MMPRRFVPNLGCRPTPKNGDDLSGIPANLDQTYSAVKVAQDATDADCGRARVFSFIQ